MRGIKLLKLLDATLGKIFVLMISPRREFKKFLPQELKKILIIRPGGIGDAVLILPAIRQLKSGLPASKIDVLCEARNYAIFSLFKEVSRVYLYDRDFELFKCLRNRYDAVIDSEQWHRFSAVIAYLTGAAVRIGFDTNERAKLFTHRIPYSHTDYEANSFLHLVGPLTGKAAEFKSDEPFVRLADEIPAHLTSFVFGKKDKIIAIFSEATVRQRRWGRDRFIKIAQELSRRGYRVLIFGSKANKRAGREIKKTVPGSIDLTGKISLQDAAALLKVSRLLLSVDSGIMHLAYAVGTPTVALFGPSSEKKWAPKGKNHIALNKRLACSPCSRFGYLPACRKNAACISSIDTTEVIKAIEKILG